MLLLRKHSQGKAWGTQTHQQLGTLSWPVLHIEEGHVFKETKRTGAKLCLPSTDWTAAQMWPTLSCFS